MKHFLWLILFISFTSQAAELSGEYDNILFQHRNSLQQAVVSDFNRLRLNLDANQQAFQMHISYDHELLLGGAVRDPLFAIQQQMPTPTYLDLTHTISTSSSYAWQQTLYRAWLQYETETWQLKLGRQRMAWGVGRIWNPSDRFNPVQATALETEQKLGVDGLDIEYHYSDFGRVQSVFAPGRTKHRVARKWAVRWQDTFAENDISLWLGEIAQAQVLALDMTGNIADTTARMAWMQSNGGQQGDFSQAILGLDGTWQQPVFPAGLYWAVEYFYNGAAKLIASPLLSDYTQSRSKHLLGILLGYDLSALWRMDMTYLQDLTQNSQFIAPSLRYSATEDLDATVFAQVPTGQSKQGEFTGLHAIIGVKLAAYF